MNTKLGSQVISNKDNQIQGLMTNEQKTFVLTEIAELLELPESAYEKAKKRYEDLGEWFNREESIVNKNVPHIFPQGSFRLGTAIHPISGNEEYDLDLACKLQLGIKKESHSQENLKDLIGKELEAYRRYRSIKKELESKHRCWRLEYQDELSFHMDIVPCIPASDKQKSSLQESVYKSGIIRELADSISKNAIVITDDRHPKFRQICDNWNISNPEGYAKWFETRMLLGQKRVFKERAQVDDIPIFKQKTLLQRIIQILKRHRDLMYKGNEECKPISIIITTLAARAYNGETNLYEAYINILNKIGSLIGDYYPRIPNPVDPNEDFADRWGMSQYNHLNLEKSFWTWLYQIQKDLNELIREPNTKHICKTIENKFGILINESRLYEKLHKETPSAKSTINSYNMPDFTVAHRQNPASKWQISLSNKVTITASYNKNGWRINSDGSSNFKFNSGDEVPRFKKICFKAQTNVEHPYQVFWQVVNTGEEAKEAYCLRGDFYNSSGNCQFEPGTRTRIEPTKYRGNHWVECFIIKYNKCIARSGEFIVRIV